MKRGLDVLKRALAKARAARRTAKKLLFGSPNVRRTPESRAFTVSVASLKGLPERRTKTWTSLSKRASMLTSLVAYKAWCQRPRAPRLNGGALGGGSTAHEARLLKMKDHPMDKSHPVDETRIAQSSGPSASADLMRRGEAKEQRHRNGKLAARVAWALAAEPNQRPVNRRNNRPASICSADKKVRR